MNSALDALEPFDDDASVMRYLREHPEFFARHPRLLADLSLPHEAGTAVSLVERQVTLLRERNISTRNRLAQLMDVAHTNDTLFEKTRALTLLLLDARTITGIDRALGTGLRESFGADHVVCHYVGGGSSSGSPVRATHLVEHSDVLHLPLPRLSSSGSGLTCGAIRADEYHSLFDERPRVAVPPAAHASAAIVAFTYRSVSGLLAIGSRDPHRFTADMGPLFVRYVADVLARVLSHVSSSASETRHDPR